MLFCGGLIVYKTIFFSGYLWITLPTIPFALAYTARIQVMENMQARIETMHLEENGDYLRVRDMTGSVRRLHVSSLRKATHKEIVTLNRAGGPAFAE